MSPTTVRRVARGVVLGPVGLLAALLVMATPAAAHRAGEGALPAPTWLLGYGSVAAILITAVMLRSTWLAARLTRFQSPDADPPDPTPLAGGLVGITLLAMVFITALVGLNTPGAGISSGRSTTRSTTASSSRPGCAGPSSRSSSPAISPRSWCFMTPRSGCSVAEPRPGRCGP